MNSLLALGFTLAAAAATLPAQQTMPPMTMPSAPAPAQTPKPAPRPNRQPPAPDTMPPDMQGMEHDRGDPRAQQTGRSEANSVQQQAAQSQTKPTDRSDQQSLQIPIESLQEPEALDFHTGTDLPAPELLADIVAREPLTLDHFLALADKANPTLAQAQRELDRSLAQARQVSLPPDPILGYSGDHIRGGEYHAGEQGAFISQQFVLGRKLALRRDVYRAEGKLNEYAIQIQLARVHNDVARAFFDTLAAQQSVVLHDRLLKVALDADTNAHELNRVGQADAADILTAEIAAEQARVDFVTAQRLFLAGFAELATLAGQATLEVHPLQGALVDPPAFNPADFVQRDVNESPLVKQAEASVALNQAKLKDARRERLPDLNLTAGEWYSGEIVRSGAKAGWESFAQAGVQLPLWNRNQGNTAAAQALVDRSQHDVDRARLWTRMRAQPLAEQYLSAHFTADRLRSAMLPRARRAYQLQVTKYQQMALAYPAVLQAQRLLFTLQLSYTEALNGEWRAAIALENFALTDGLDQPVSTGSDATDLNRPTAP